MDVGLRDVIEEDFRFLFELRNSAGVRKHMFNENEIEWDEHVDYWKKRIAEKRPSHIIMHMNERAGMVKLDWDVNEKCYYVSIIVSGGFQGKGVGKGALEALKARFPGSRMRAKVKPGNKASIGLFEAAGFGLRCIEYELK